MPAPAMLLRFLPLVKKHWKPFVGVLLLAAVFGAGWSANGWRYQARIDAERAERAQAIAEAVSARERELLDRFEEQQRALRDVSVNLALDLERSRARNDELLIEIDAVSLTKPSTISCVDLETGEEHDQQPNPFSADFVRLWNRAGGVRDD